MSPSKTVFALADVNRMYCSCERVFRPDLRDKPIVVLSNNNGCVIAQTKEIDDLNIHMAQPWFEVEKEALARGVVWFASNYELYADFSDRFADVLRTFTPRLEVYSIDECFLDLTGMKRDLTAYGREIRSTVLQWIKLPICVGIGNTKTLAKLANKIAKKQDRFDGVCDFTSMSELEIDAILEGIEVTKVWNVGSRLGARLNALGVDNVLRLKRADPRRIRDEFGVLLERTVRELNGECWIDFIDDIPDAKQVMSSRSFGQRAESHVELQEAITFHATSAGARLRKQHLHAKEVSVFIQNSPHDQAEYYGASLSTNLPSPTDCTLKITEAALFLLKKMYRPGVYYQKAGVMLSDLVPEQGQQTDLFGYSASAMKASVLMTTFDDINRKYSRGAIRLAAEGNRKSWEMRRDGKSPSYTTDWNELPEIRA